MQTKVIHSSSTVSYQKKKRKISLHFKIYHQLSYWQRIWGSDIEITLNYDEYVASFKMCKSKKKNGVVGCIF